MSLVSARDSCRMTSPRDTHDGTTEPEPYTPCSSYFYGDDTMVAPMGPHIDPIRNTYTSPPVTNVSNHNELFPSNAWPTEAGSAFDLQFAGGIYSVPISIPFTTCFDGVEPIAFSGWQTEAGSCFQTSTDKSLWDDATAAPGSSDGAMPSLRTLETPISKLYDHKSGSVHFPNAVADDSQDKKHAEPLSHSPPLKRKKCVATGSCQEFRFKGNGSGQTVASIFDSDLSFDSPETAAHSSPMRPKGSRRTGSGRDAQRRVRSPPAKSPSEQRARNRTAAERCRIKTKAAAAELEATERAESSRHEQLSATLRGLQAEVFALKSEVLLHGACGDGPIRDYLNNTARSMATGCGGEVAG